MRALLFDGGVRVATLPKPAPRAGEALVRVLMAGICNTDIEILKGYMGFRGVPGHEFVGMVEECTSEELRGKRVVGEINCVCHACPYCEREMWRHCANRSVLGILKRDGAFAEYLTLPEENLRPVPEPMPDEIAVFTEPTAAAFRILEQIEIQEDDRVVVLGDGKLGLLIAQVLWHHTRKLVCVGRNPGKLGILQDMGVAAISADEPLESGVDIVVEATGSADGLQRALELARPEGTVILKTTVAGQSTLDMSLPVINEVRVIGSRCGPFRPALEALALGTVEVRPMITATYPLEQAPRAFDHAQEKGALKILLQVS